VRLLKEKFYELKTNHEIKGECLDRAKMMNTGIKNSKVDLNEKIKKAIREMLIELRENIYAVLESSYDIQKIFMPIVVHLIDEAQCKFNFEEIHREEFAKAVAKDEFLKIIFLQIKSNSKNPSYEELYDILSEIEDILNVTQKEMTRFRNFIDLVLEKINLSSSVKGEANNLNLNLNVNVNLNMNNQNGGMINPYNNNFSKECQHFNLIQNPMHNCNCSHHGDREVLSSSPNSYNSNFNSQNNKLQNSMNSINSMSLKKDKFKDIDDLIDYINKDEEEEIKPKKSKKKNNKKDKKNNSNLNHQLSSPIDKEKMEKEIEDFKMYIKNNSSNAMNVRKIKPALSREWLQNLGDLNKEVKTV
jgi:hypothetical protein